MAFTNETELFSFKDFSIELVVPSREELYEQFREKKTECPYWGQVWSSAIALSQFIVDNPQYVAGKNVLELAGGLGLPSLVAAHFTKSVCCTDCSAEAIEMVAESAKKNQLQITTDIIDWNKIPNEELAEIVLMSDINYEPNLFDALYASFKKILEKNSTIILATPQRLLAKPFIERILPFVIEQTEISVKTKQGKKEWISIYILQENP